MSVQMPAPPKAATAVLASGIAHWSPVPPVAQLSYEPAVPVFVVDSAGPMSIGDLAHLKRAAWRFVIKSRGVPYATGDVADSDGTFRLSMVTAGSAATTAIDQVHRAVQEVQNKVPQDSFELRLFEAPAFHVRAVWFHGETDLFSILQWDDQQKSIPLITADDFLNSLNRIQSSKIDAAKRVDYHQEG